MKTGSRIFARIENTAIIIVLAALALLPCAQILIRKIFTAGIQDYAPLVRHLTLFTALIAGAICTREEQHISLGFIDYLKNEKLKNIIASITEVISASFSIAIAIASISFSISGFDPTNKLLGLPLNIISLIITLSLAVTGIRFATMRKNRRILKLVLSIFFALILSLPTIINLFYLTPFMPPMFLENMLDGYYYFFESADIVIVIILVLLTVCGLPIFLLLSGSAFILFTGSWGALEVIPNEMYNLLTSSSIPAIPLFTLTGFILSEGKSGQRLVNLLQSFIGNMSGGLAVMTVIVCAFFTTFTGASGVTILALGGLLSYIMLDSGEYKENFTKGFITSAGSIGLLFPPSLPIIMYGVQAHINIKKMFLAGIIPGTILVIALSTMGVFHARKNKTKIAKPNKEVSISEKLNSLKKASGDIALPILILALYFGGLTTITETGAVAVIYAIILEVFIYKNLKPKDLIKIVKNAAPVIGGVLMIVAMAKGLSYFIVDAEVPMMLTDFFKAHVESPFVFLLLLNGVLIITGCLMDIFSAIMVVAPLIIPLGEMYGINPIQLGIIFLANLELGYLTPPVGLDLFLASYAFESPLRKIYKMVIPFFLVLLVMVLLITYVPWFSLVLVR
ncbi:MAG: TRAP transporter large permease subunit [Spirochaetales bacterium]|nr:TRAP transporter large permease subunit [Spirochaetales bacterium]